ncbi:hypothetical protein INT45_012354 [Circinella minor]|uniref:Uncharacterized protein n=1 Tax=Circinella minor TaxID=1195481 RepID=A0A8H7VKB4_9FUNG|nr:hypothetical protein INT45_012354 [Circinella minor]
MFVVTGEDQDTIDNKDEDELQTHQDNENDYIVEGPDDRMNIDNNNNNPPSPQSIVEQLPPSPADSIDFVINRVNRLIQEADEFFPPRDGDNQESTFVPPLARDIYDLRLNPWNSNSCYIDAAVELLWHSIIPVINIYNPTSFKIETDHEAGNPLDILMKETYNMSQNWIQRFDGSNRMRNYVWSKFSEQWAFHKNHTADIASFLRILLSNMSQDFNSNFRIKTEHVHMCNKDPNHCQFFSKKFDELTGEVEPRESVLFCSNRSPDDEKYDTRVLFPYEFRLIDGPLYQLHGIISSTRRDGFHFITTGLILGDRPFIGEIDNIRQEINVLHEPSSYNDSDAARTFANIKYPIIACYQKVIRKLVDADMTGVVFDDIEMMEVAEEELNDHLLRSDVYVKNHNT